MSWRESHLTFLNLTLQPFCFSASTYRSYLGELWTVGRCHWSAILIDTFYSDWIWTTYKLLLWGEGYCTIWCNGVCSLTWNGLLLASICKGWLNSLINRNQWITTCEGWCASLRKALWTSASCGSSYWSHFLNSWCVLSCHWGTILIYTFNNNRVWCPNKLLVRCESDRSIWRYFEDSDIWNFLAFASIIESSWSIIIQWYIRVATNKVWFTRLRKTLWTSARHGGACWSYLFHYRLVLNCNRGTIDISASQFKFWCFTLELFVWSKGHLAICIHFKFTNIRHFFDRRTIIKQWSRIRWEWNRVMARCEGDLSFLHLTLQTF
ncbi:hypothetical protein D8884_10145 [Streptococcus sanguinis]|nr:hypothetical protein D8884_10145 [Streptococcus sanguinis]